MKRSNYEKKVNKVKDAITDHIITTDDDLYNTARIMAYLSGYMPDMPIGACMDAIIELREEQYR